MAENKNIVIRLMADTASYEAGDDPRRKHCENSRLWHGEHRTQVRAHRQRHDRRRIGRGRVRRGRSQDGRRLRPADEHRPGEHRRDQRPNGPAACRSHRSRSFHGLFRFGLRRRDQRSRQGRHERHGYSHRRLVWRFESGRVRRHGRWRCRRIHGQRVEHVPPERLSGLAGGPILWRRAPARPSAMSPISARR